jgi:hypothetical protein
VCGIMNLYRHLAVEDHQSRRRRAGHSPRRCWRPRSGLSPRSRPSSSTTCSRALASYRALLSDASGEIIQHVSRDLERQERGPVSSVVPLERGRSAAEDAPWRYRSRTRRTAASTSSAR